MRHNAVDGGADPHDAFLGNTQVILLWLTDNGGIHIVGPSSVHKVLDADHLPFLITDNAQQQSTVDGNRTLDNRLGGDQGADHTCLHIVRPTPINPSVADCGAEGWESPLRGIALGDYIGVPFQHEGRSIRISASGNDIGPAWRHLLEVCLESNVIASRFHPARGFFLAHPQIWSPHTGDTGQLLYPANQLAVVDVGQGHVVRVQ